MFRIAACLIAVLILTVHLERTSAQGTTAPAAPAATTEAKPSRMKLTVQRLKEMRAHWNANKPKLKVCRKEVKQKGLIGDDRWFYISDCMSKT
jgi:hypothetical protein